MKYLLFCASCRHASLLPAAFPKALPALKLMTWADCGGDNGIGTTGPVAASAGLAWAASA